MVLLERFAKNNNISIHYLESMDLNFDLIPLVYVPGVLGFAEQFEDEMKVLTPRRCISLRGRGKSDAPLKGYNLEQHVSDIKSVVENSGIKEYYLMAYSMGVPYAIKFASENPKQIKGLILCDYQARYPSIPESWVEGVISRGYIKEDRHHVVRGIQLDSKETYLMDELKKITCPVLVIKGGTEQSLLKNDATEKYKSHLRNVQIVEFSDSGHELWIPDYDRFMNKIGQFLEKIDKE
ncbi:alpha/beta hydrolase [Bacillus luteolus]|uniref:Alpha/beta hydrolase n=1 Tax=Litchfieldia luteola TaxID=682179 RepID=A0ABR9QN94_9BACI|nr:alpha/beta hydrolase [Cytobacillus luteolus]MBE4909886.1 alpha/beta hydrolase [Cytobacillus luteolus]MBP1942563.1 pimeloyl-ACP methyl ester carboxylesterase [Cytobacillus luteolus]